MMHSPRGKEPPVAAWLFFTLPNLLSLGRLILGVSFPWIPTSWQFTAFLAGALSDLLDGTLSRIFHQGSQLGRMLDPLADKVFVTGAAVTLIWQEQLSLLELLAIALRDLIVSVAVLMGLAYRHWAAFRHMAPTLLGKLTTAAQFGFFLVILAVPQCRGVALIITATLSAAAGADYLWKFFARWWPNRKSGRQVSPPS